MWKGSAKEKKKVKLKKFSSITEDKYGEERHGFAWGKNWLHFTEKHTTNSFTDNKRLIKDEWSLRTIWHIWWIMDMEIKYLKSRTSFEKRLIPRGKKNITIKSLSLSDHWFWDSE